MNSGKRYQFNLTVVGFGETVDDAFDDALDALKEDPSAAITNEVVYVLVDEDKGEDNEQEFTD